MTLELDHFFILTDEAPSYARQLRALGLVEGSSNSHEGQGTANHRFFCKNSMLELLYISDADEASNGPASKLRLTERSGSDTASPFGLVFRQGGGSQKLPFPGWRYHPDYFSGIRYFHIGESADRLVEPLCIYLPFDLQSTADEPPQAGRFDRITQLIISVPVERPSQVLKAASGCEMISIRLKEPHAMEVVFHEAREGRVEDFRPAMPLIIRW